VWDDDRRVDDEPWYDNQTLVLASGVAGLVLVGLLIFAVVRVADHSVDPPDIRDLDSSVATTGSSFTTSTTTTSYSVPSVQTSELGPAPAGPPPPPAAPPSEEGAQPSTADTPTTIYNPYAPATSTGSAGHI
jgi:hypothetical protein